MSLAPEIVDRVTQLAARLAEASRREITRRERAEQAQMARLMSDAAGKAFTLAMADRVFRSRSPRRQAEQVNDLVARYGIPSYLPTPQRLMLRLGAAAAHVLPGPLMRAMEGELRRQSARVILDGRVRSGLELDPRPAHRRRSRGVPAMAARAEPLHDAPSLRPDRRAASAMTSHDALRRGDRVPTSGTPTRINNARPA